jgi:transcriptional regulator with XRE-family HTH domain
MQAMTDELVLSRLSRNVRRLRGERSLGWLAKETGTYPANIQRIERGDQMPGVGLFTRLAKALDSDISELLAPTTKANRKKVRTSA